MVPPFEIQYGQLPSSQFPRRRGGFVHDGDWDSEIVKIENHSVYVSMFNHFNNGIPWEDTPHYKEAVRQLDSGPGFRGLHTKKEMDSKFRTWDKLYEQIKTDGFKSMKEMYQQRKEKNPCSRLDEISVNIDRNGRLVLNDGWHRFCIARLLGVPLIPVRILAKHSLCPD